MNNYQAVEGRYLQFLDRFSNDEPAQSSLNNLAMLSALPVGFTVDMLYHLVENFGHSWDWDMRERHVLVSDWLLSGLCRPVGQGIFEISIELRAYLLEQIRKQNIDLLQEVAKFVYQYVEYRLSAPEWSSFRETLLINALVTLRPQEAQYLIAEKINILSQGQQKSEILRYRDLLEYFTIQDKGIENKEESEFFPLFQYVVAFKGAMLNVPNDQVLEKFTRIQHINGVDIMESPPQDRPFVPISRTLFNEEVVQKLQTDGRPIKKNLRVLLIGIDNYESWELKSLSGCVNDVNLIVDTFQNIRFIEKDLSLSITKLTNSEATLAKILEHFKGIVSESHKSDIVFLAITGHSETQGEAFYTYDTQIDKKSNFLKFSHLESWINNQPEVNFVLFIDTHCAPYFVADLPDNLIVLAGNSKKEQALEVEGNGLFTKYFCEVLKEAKRKISYRDLFNLIRQKVSVQDKPQTPYIHCRSGNEYKYFMEDDLFTNSEVFTRIKSCKNNSEDYLDLSFLNLTDLPEILFELTQLKKLDLYDNYLSSLPEKIEKLTNLETLFASKNEIFELSDAIAGLSNLQKIKLDDNRITEFPEVFKKMENLKDISIENNFIDFLPPWVLYLHNLKLLDVRNNNVYNIPEGKKKFTKTALEEAFGYQSGVAPKDRNTPVSGDDHPFIIVVCSKQEKDIISDAFISLEKRNGELILVEDASPSSLYKVLASHAGRMVILHIDGWEEPDAGFAYRCGEKIHYISQSAFFKFLGTVKHPVLCVFTGMNGSFYNNMLDWGWKNCITIDKQTLTKVRNNFISSFYSTLKGGSTINAAFQQALQLNSVREEAIGASAPTERFVLFFKDIDAGEWHWESPRIITVLILTHLPLEYEAVKQRVGELEIVVKDQTSYELGRFIGRHHAYTVVVLKPDTQHTALAIERAIRSFQPSIALSIGIASGVKEVAIGDVLIVEKVYIYESGKEDTDGFKSRPALESYSKDLLARAQALSRQQDWKKRTDDGAPAARAFIGPIATGDKVVAGTENLTFQRLKLHYTDILGLEMESTGFATTLQAQRLIHGLAIRGISELYSGKSEIDQQHWQRVAAERATAFAMELLWKLDSSPFLQIDTMDITTLVREVYALLFPRALNEIGNDFKDSTNKEVREIWNLVKPLFIEEVREIAMSPDDVDLQSNVRNKLKKELEGREDLQLALPRLLAAAKKQSGTASVSIVNSKNVFVGSQINVGGDFRLGDD